MIFPLILFTSTSLEEWLACGRHLMFICWIHEKERPLVSVTQGTGQSWHPCCQPREPTLAASSLCPLGGESLLKRWEGNRLQCGQLGPQHTSQWLHLLLFSTGRVTLHPSAEQSFKGQCLQKTGKEGGPGNGRAWSSHRCSFPWVLGHSLGPDTHQLVLCPVIRFSVEEGDWGESTGEG